jgi:endonuclease/exonuclease/phosphatase family metal-dependent hydrolase
VLKTTLHRFRTLFVCLGVCLCLSSGIRAQDVVRVLTYNTHSCIRGPNTAQLPYLAKVVNFLNPDIWTIEELGGTTPFDRAALITTLQTFINTNLTIFGPNPQPNVNYYLYVSAQSDGFTCPGIVSRYPLTEQTTYNDSLRGFVQSVATLPSGAKLGVFVTHLKATTGSANAPADSVKRQTEAEFDAGKVSAFMTAHPGAGVVVTGDWNETEEPGETPNYPIGTILTDGRTYRPITAMRAPGLSDSSALSILAKKATISSTNPNARFDYICYANASLVPDTLIFDAAQYSGTQLAAINTANGSTLTATDCKNASDHLPVVAVFAVGGEAQNTAAAFKIKALALTQTGPQLTFHEGRGKIYRLERTVDLTNAASWTTVLDSIAGTGGDLTVSDPGAASLPTVFYRLRMLP